MIHVAFLLNASKDVENNQNIAENSKIDLLNSSLYENTYFDIILIQISFLITIESTVEF
jgi:hypothetical protein